MGQRHCTVRITCRSCYSEQLEPILSLGDLYVSAFVASPEDAEHCVRAPLDLVLCCDCGLLQLRHTVDPEVLYRHYWYRSVINSTMRAALADIARTAEELAGLREGDVVLDIGCNDGTLLRSYRTKGLQLTGFEPARNLISEAQVGTTSIFNDFFNAGPFLKSSGRKAKVITSIAMFYDLENPREFVQDVVQCLDENGMWVVQMAYLPSMLDQNAFDNICHEHLEYYSLTSLSNLLKRFDLKIFDVQLNDVNGGSFRVCVSHASCHQYEGDGIERVKALERYEREMGLDEIRIYNEFGSRVLEIKDLVYGFIKRETDLGRRVYVYGASTKGNTLLQYFGLDRRLIGGAAERNPDKWGKQTVGTWIPIISEEQMRRERPDHLLVLPWHFIKEFVEREQEYLASGGKFIVPLPRFQVLS